ncbi:tetrahydrofolate dehydrogenase/cyclohydrolase catalytic domain-containing protein [Kitasatospora sp. NPDC092948]|uniref:tetrahydrofolate dehydrogenase/cyclohydrolase catalytic domain-containing protein n=1 Tax=Kitasatospora sp. NPDC092948 TaxID=3364088 RepID=UPI0037F7DE19
MTRTIKGAEIARRIRTQAAERVAEATAGGRVPGLATILVGDDPASAVYVAAKRRAIREAGMHDIHRHLPHHATHAQVAAVIDELAIDPDVHGILLQLPLPAQLRAAPLIDRIPVTKDVDGLTHGPGRTSLRFGAKLTDCPCPSPPPASWPVMTNVTVLPLPEQVAEDQEQPEQQEQPERERQHAENTLFSEATEAGRLAAAWVREPA